MTVMLNDELADLRRANAELQQRLDEALAERDEVQAQKTAMSQVMEVINSSSGDLAPVFDAMLEKALNLCKAAFGCLFTYDGEAFHSAAQRGMSAALVDYLREPIRPRTSGYSQTHGSLQQLIRGESVVHHADLKDSEAYRNGLRFIRALVDFDDGRTALWVALRKDDKLLGVFVIYRREVRPFSDKQIALLQNFAAQAVIAMENARLINETREALEQQTATAEILQVINSSAGNLQPVFDTILEKAHSLCGTDSGSLVTFDGEYFRAVTDHGYPEEFPERLARREFRAIPGSSQEKLLRGEPLVHIPDLLTVIHQGGDNWIRRAIVERAGCRTVLIVPLRHDDILLGYISALRREVQPFLEPVSKVMRLGRDGGRGA
jgi:GAF domain-containing protein